MTDPPLPLSEMLSPSLTSLELPILEDYPPDILTTIFSYINQHEIKLESPNLAPFYLPIKYRKIDLLGWHPVGSLLPETCAAMLPLYLEAEWFRPETLHMNDMVQFKTYPSHLLEKIKAIYIHFPIFKKEDKERLANMENVIGMTIDKYRTDMGEENAPIPSSVLHLKLLSPTSDLLFPSIRTLEIRGGLGLKSWPQLTKLVIYSTYVDFLVQLPVSLVHIEFDGEFPEYTNLEYLINLRTLKLSKFGLIKNVELPTTIRDLSCHREIDFTRFPRLEYLEVTEGIGNFSFPDTIRKIMLIGGETDGLGNLSGLSNLEDFCIFSKVDLKLLEVNYPQGLKKLRFSIKCSGPAKFNGLPRTLEEFMFISWGFIDSFECVWPESVKQIYLKNVEMKFLDWPLHLEQLTMKNVNLENISGTNIARLNLSVLDVDQDSNMGDAEALRLTKTMYLKPAPQQLPPNIREFDLHDAPIELSSTFFLGSSLSLLTLIRCEINVSTIVQLPSTLREVSITECELTSETWSNFICSPKLKVLKLLDNKLTTFSECPPKLEMLDLHNNKLTTFGKINEGTIEVALEGNEIPVAAIPEYSTFVLEGKIPETVSSIGRLVHYNKVNEIGRVYTVDAEDEVRYHFAVTKNGVRRIDGRSPS